MSNDKTIQITHKKMYHSKLKTLVNVVFWSLHVKKTLTKVLQKINTKTVTN